MRVERILVAASLVLTMQTGSSNGNVPDDLLPQSGGYQCPHCGSEYNIDNATW